MIKKFYKNFKWTNTPSEKFKKIMYLNLNFHQQTGMEEITHTYKERIIIFNRYLNPINLMPTCTMNLSIKVSTIQVKLPFKISQAWKQSYLT